MEPRKQSIYVNAFLSVSVVITFIYVAIWSFFLINQMDTFNIGIFDYGVAYNLLWKEAFLVPSYTSQVGYLPFYNPTKLISFILVPYMRVFPVAYNLLILQSTVIALSGFALFFLTRFLTKNSFYAIMVQLIWLLYYPNSAAIGYPFHYMTLFAVFYIFGFYFLLKGKLIIGSILFILSALTNLLAPLILIFSLPLFISTIKHFPVQSAHSNKTVNAFVIILMLTAVSVLLLNFFHAGPAIFTGNINPTTSHSSIISVLVSRIVGERGISGLEYILFMTFPLLFSVFIDYKFTIAAVPPIIYYWIGYPRLIRFFYPGQYSSLLAPILFISFAFFLVRIASFKQFIRDNRSKVRHKLNFKPDKKIKVILLSVLVINISLFSIYSPIGPLNQFMHSDFNENPPANGGYGWYDNLTVSNYDRNLLEMMSLVPQNSSVLADFEMPQFANRYYFTYPGQYNPSVPIDFAINNPRSQFFTVAVDDTGPNFYDYNMFQLSNMFLQNSSYGVYAQSEGAILFKLNYSGPPIFYVPLKLNLTLSRIHEAYYSTPTELLSPGIYRISMTSNTSMSGFISMGYVRLDNINGSTYSSTLYIPLYCYTNFTVNGNIRTKDISLTQIKPASHVDINKKINSPTTYHTFLANYSYFQPLVKKGLDINPDSFSYIYMINLTTYEDGLTTPRAIGNDSQIFSINGEYPYVWNQVENNGLLEFGFRTQNASISAYIEPFEIRIGSWIYVEAIFEDGYASLYINGINVYSNQIFPAGTTVGNGSLLMIGGAHPFLHDHETFPNSNPLNASIANFVILNQTLTYNEIENPQILLNNLSSDTNVVFSDWVNSN
ncbi:MAG: DUF2079 domain-containing protein [Candidatus Parvarchaeota archaeon]